GAAGSGRRPTSDMVVEFSGLQIEHLRIRATSQSGARLSRRTRFLLSHSEWTARVLECYAADLCREPRLAHDRRWSPAQRVAGKKPSAKKRRDFCPNRNSPS